jgi:hypothetical protein
LAILNLVYEQLDPRDAGPSAFSFLKNDGGEKIAATGEAYKEAS